MSRKTLFILAVAGIALVILFSACSAGPTPEPTPTVIPSPTVSDLFKSQGLRFVEEATVLKSMTKQGVNFLEYSKQLSEVGGVYELLDSLWAEGFESDAQENIKKALEGWECAKLLWDLKINHKYAVSNQSSTREAFYKVYEYGGNDLDIKTRIDTFIDEVTGEEAQVMIMPYDENISILFTLANDYFDKAQPVLLGVIQ